MFSNPLAVHLPVYCRARNNPLMLVTGGWVGGLQYRIIQENTGWQRVLQGEVLVVGTLHFSEKHCAVTPSIASVWWRFVHAIPRSGRLVDWSLPWQQRFPTLPDFLTCRILRFDLSTSVMPPPQMPTVWWKMAWTENSILLGQMFNRWHENSHCWLLMPIMVQLNKSRPTMLEVSHSAFKCRQISDWPYWPKRITLVEWHTGMWFGAS